MRRSCYILALALCFGLTATAMAQDTPPAPPQEEPAKPPAEAPAQQTPPAPPKEEPAKPPAEAPAPAKAAEPAKEAAPAATKEFSGCAMTYAPLADSYKKASEEMQKWLADIDSKTTAAGEQVKKVQEQIQANEKAATEAKLAGDSAKEKELSKANKQLWTDLDAAKKSQGTVCGEFLKEAQERVKKYAAEAEARLGECKAKMK